MSYASTRTLVDLAGIIIHNQEEKKKGEENNVIKVVCTKRYH